MKKWFPMLALVLSLTGTSVSMAFDFSSAIAIIRSFITGLIDILERVDEYKKKSLELGRLEDSENNRRTRDALKITSADLSIVLNQKRSFLRDVKRYGENPTPESWSRIKERSAETGEAWKAFQNNLERERATSFVVPSGQKIFSALDDILARKQEDLIRGFAHEPADVLDTAQFKQFVQLLEQEAGQIEKINDALSEYIFVTYHP